MCFFAAGGKEEELKFNLELKKGSCASCKLPVHPAWVNDHPDRIGILPNPYYLPFLAFHPESPHP